MNFNPSTKNLLVYSATCHRKCMILNLFQINYLYIVRRPPIFCLKITLYSIKYGRLNNRTDWAFNQFKRRKTERKTSLKRDRFRQAILSNILPLLLQSLRLYWVTRTRNIINIARCIHLVYRQFCIPVKKMYLYFYKI